MTGVQTCALPICFPVTICYAGLNALLGDVSASGTVGSGASATAAESAQMMPTDFSFVGDAANHGLAAYNTTRSIDSLGISTKIEVSDQSACYELYTSKLRIRVNKNPMQLQIFDKWQKLVFSDYKDNGHLSDADKKRKKAYKILRKDELFFGLGEKTGSLNRRGR